ENIGEKMGNCFYGCDRCQAVCPHNRFATPNDTAELQPKPELIRMNAGKWRTLTKEQYNALFSGSAVERCGYEQLMRNIKECKDSKK
ncbi:MAG: tRNA epoxyqueuosine(34) reductase QueG, partial [Bacteroidaceae bacterium]|nr:tRNA epoxyqueuosine(34) reductase QueG [Bacteroidaceae bacterium]